MPPCSSMAMPKGGRRSARPLGELLAQGFTGGVAKPVAARFLDLLLDRWSLDHSPVVIAMDLMARLFSPYDLNPHGLNPRCQVNSLNARKARSGTPDHLAAAALRHSLAASARKIRSVDRETRWRWRLKVLCTAACMLRKRWADRADLNRCILRSRRRTG
jgi:hypothetical protein